MARAVISARRCSIVTLIKARDPNNVVGNSAPIIGAEKPPVKLQKSLFSGVETHSREAGKGACRGVELAVSWNRIVRGLPNESRTRLIRNDAGLRRRQTKPEA